MEKKRKRIRSCDKSEAVLVSSSTQKEAVKMASDLQYQQQKDKELNRLNKPHMLFK
jgi:hypothetical protein